MNFWNRIGPILLASILMSLMACESEEEGSIPVITVNSPLPNQQFSDSDTMTVLASISDQSVIDYVQVKLTSETFASVLPPLVFEVNAKKFDLNTVYPLQAEELESGTYYLLIKAQNEKNFKNEYIPVEITSEQPQQKGLVVVTQKGSDSTAVFLIDNDYETEELITFKGDFADSEIDPVSNRIFFAGRSDYNLKCFDLNENQWLWTIDNPPVPGQLIHQFNCLDFNGNVYCSFFEQYILGYTINGLPLFDASFPENDIPSVLIVTDDYIVSDIQKKNIGSSYISVRFRETGAEKQQILTDFKTRQFLNAANNNVWIAANTDQGSALFWYDVNQNLLQQKSTYNETVACAALINENEIILGFSSGLYLYNHLSQTTNPLLLQSDPEVVVFDENTELLLASFGDELAVYLFPEMANQKTLPFSDTILNIHLQFTN